MSENKYKAKQIAISNADGTVDVIDILTKDILDNISKLENTISSGSVSNADTVDNKDAEDFFNIDKTATNFNDAIEEGKYEISNGGASISNAPSTSYKYYICLVYKLNALICQIAIAVANTPQTYIRYSLDRGSTWSTNSYNNGWYRLWNQANDGAGTNLDADTVDSKHASSFFDTTLTATNFTSATTQGKYTIDRNPTDSPTPKDAPTIGWICLVFYNDVLINDKKSITQIAINNMNKQRMYIRNQKNGSWGSWEVIATTNSLATMQFDATYGNKYNSISDIANEIANGTVNNSNKLNGLLASQYAGTNVDTITELPTKSGIYFYDDVNKEIIPDTDDTKYILFYGNTNNYEDGTYSAIAIHVFSGAIVTRSSQYGDWKIICTPNSTKLIDGLNADLLDGYHANQLVKTEIATINVLPTETGIYNYVTSSIENKSIAYQLIVTKSVNDTCNYNYTAISPADNKIFVARALNVDSDTRPSVTWNEITSSSTVSPTIPVVTEDPKNPTDGQMWIRSDLL